MTLKSTETRARLSTSSEDLAVQMGKINKWYDSLVPTGGETGNILGWNSDGTAKWVTVAPSANKLNISSAVGGTTQPVYFKADGTPEAISFTIGKSVPANAVFTDQNVKSTLLAQSTAEASYRPTFITGATTGGVYIIDSYKVNHTPGTTSAVGNTRLVLGNATASGTANNEEGQIKLYSPGTAFHTIKGTTISSEAVHVFPSTGGTILNTGTTSYTQTVASSATGAYEIGKIKINGTTTTIYGKDTGTTYTASDGVKIESTVIKHTNAITAVTTEGFYKFKFDAQGHITGTASVVAGDIPALNYVPNTQAGVNAAINLLGTGSSTPTDADYYISQYVGGGTTTTTYHRRPMSALWAYIKGKGDQIYAPINHTHTLSIATDTGTNQLTLSANTKYKLTAGGSTFIFTTPTDNDTKVTSSANHYTPATASGSDKTASASGATAAWSIDVVQGVTLNTDGKGHVTGISVASGKIPANPVPSNNVTGSGTSGYLTKWNGTNTITNGPQLGSSTTTFLRNDGTWATPTDTDTKVNVTLATTTKAYLLGTSTTPTATAQAVTSLADTAVYLDTTAGGLCATNVKASSTVCANTGNSSTAGGVSLYGTDPSIYGIMFRGTSNSGKHGYVQSDWATYFTMNQGGTTRGWIFRRNTDGNVASISGAGNAVFNGSVTVGGNSPNTSGCRMEYNSTTQTLDFVFA